jgi:hypothetical protein
MAIVICMEIGFPTISNCNEDLKNISSVNLKKVLRSRLFTKNDPRAFKLYLIIYFQSEI